MIKILSSTIHEKNEIVDHTNTIESADLSVEKLHLSDVIDIENLQKIQDTFARTFDVGSVIIDLEGDLLTKPSNFSEVCRLIQQTEKGRKKLVYTGNGPEHMLQVDDFVATVTKLSDEGGFDYDALLNLK